MRWGDKGVQRYVVILHGRFLLQLRKEDSTWQRRKPEVSGALVFLRQNHSAVGPQTTLQRAPAVKKTSHNKTRLRFPRKIRNLGQEAWLNRGFYTKPYSKALRSMMATDQENEPRANVLRFLSGGALCIIAGKRP